MNPGTVIEHVNAKSPWCSARVSWTIFQHGDVATVVNVERISVATRRNPQAGWRIVLLLDSSLYTLEGSQKRWKKDWEIVQ